MASLQCPLGGQAFLTSEYPMGLQCLAEIEEHVAATSPDCPHPSLKEFVFESTSINGSTPLLLACYFNQLDSVKRIVEHWAVDVNQSAAYYLDPFKENLQDDKKIEKASPLFVAASMGHLDIVRYLVDHGADVSAKTENEANADYDGLSSLYGTTLMENSSMMRKADAETWSRERENRSAVVCFLLKTGADPSVDIIRPSDGNPMWMSGLCGDDAITTLVENGMNVNHCYPCLHKFSLLDRCMGSLTVVKFLVNRGADLHSKDDLGFTPIIRAAFNHCYDVLDFLLERNEISRIEKIEALELAGAVILSDTYAPLFPKGLEYWRRSLHLRLMDTDGNGPIIKNIPEHLMNPGRIIEWTTQAQLDHLAQHRSEQQIQAFFIQLRFLSSKSWALVDSIYLDYREYCYRQLREQRRFVEELSVCWSMLETILTFDSLEKDLWPTTIDVVTSLISVLLNLIEIDDPLWNEDTIKTSLKLILATDQYHLDDRAIISDCELSVNMSYLFGLIGSLAELPHLVNDESMESLTELVQRDQRRYTDSFSNGGSLLHMACGYYASTNIDHPIIATVRLLLRAGADPNAVDSNGNGVFHVLVIASQEYNIDPSIQESVARLLLNSGAHLDRVNNDRKTAADLWLGSGRKRQWGGDLQEAPRHRSNMPSWLRGDSVPKLKCLCATVIQTLGVPYKHVLPPSLHPFVNWH